MQCVCESVCADSHCGLLTVQVQTLAPLPMQVDGEPWLQSPAQVAISLKNQVRTKIKGGPLGPDSNVIECWLSCRMCAAVVHSAGDAVCFASRNRTASPFCICITGCESQPSTHCWLWCVSQGVVLRRTGTTHSMAAAASQVSGSRQSALLFIRMAMRVSAAACAVLAWRLSLHVACHKRLIEFLHMRCVAQCMAFCITHRFTHFCIIHMVHCGMHLTFSVGNHTLHYTMNPTCRLHWRFFMQLKCVG